MPTECTRDSFGFEPVEGREVVAAFDGGAISSDAGALLLGATDRAINMMDRFAKCGGGGGAHRRSHPRPVASCPHPGTRRQRFRAGRSDGLVRGKRGALSVRIGENDRLIAEIESELAQAEAKSRRTGKPARYFKILCGRWIATGTLAEWGCPTTHSGDNHANRIR
jgi:hypothetical protein